MCNITRDDCFIVGIKGFQILYRAEQTRAFLKLQDSLKRVATITCASKDAGNLTSNVITFQGD